MVGTLFFHIPAGGAMVVALQGQGVGFTAVSQRESSGAGQVVGDDA